MNIFTIFLPSIVMNLNFECFQDNYEPKMEILKDPSYIKYLNLIINASYSDKLNRGFEGKVLKVLWGDGYAVMKLSIGF